MRSGGPLEFVRRCGRAGCIAIACVSACSGETGQGGPGPVPYLAQQRPQSCLVAAAAMVLAAHGVAAPEDALWAEVRSWDQGTTVHEVQELLAARGFEGLAFRGAPGELEAIVDAGYPAIAVVGWPQKHAIVVAGRDPRRGTLRLHDPKAGGPADEDAAAFDERWAATGREAFLIVRAGDRRLAGRGVELDRIAAESRRARATDLSLRMLLRAGPPAGPEAEALASRPSGSRPCCRVRSEADVAAALE